MELESDSVRNLPKQVGPGYGNKNWYKIRLAKPSILGDNSANGGFSEATCSVHQLKPGVRPVGDTSTDMYCGDFPNLLTQTGEVIDPDTNSMLSFDAKSKLSAFGPYATETLANAAKVEGVDYSWGASWDEANNQGRTWYTVITRDQRNPNQETFTAEKLPLSAIEATALASESTPSGVTKTLAKAVDSTSTSTSQTITIECPPDLEQPNTPLFLRKHKLALIRVSEFDPYCYPDATEAAVDLENGSPHFDLQHPDPLWRKPSAPFPRTKAGPFFTKNSIKLLKKLTEGQVPLGSDPDLMTYKGQDLAANYPHIYLNKETKTICRAEIIASGEWHDFNAKEEDFIPDANRLEAIKVEGVDYAWGGSWHEIYGVGTFWYTLHIVEKFPNLPPTSSTHSFVLKPMGHEWEDLPYAQDDPVYTQSIGDGPAKRCCDLDHPYENIPAFGNHWVPKCSGGYPTTNVPV